MPTPLITSSALADSIGVNTHLSYPCYTNVPLLLEQLGALGVKHLRDGFHSSVTNQAVPNYDPDSVLFGQRWIPLGQLGIKFDVVCSPIDHLTITGAPPTAAVLNQLCMEAGFLVESIEGANEMDGGTPVGWNGACVQWQQALYPAVKSMAQYWQPNYLPVLGPSLADSSRGPDLGNLSHWLDFGNIHAYAGGNPPSAVFPQCLTNAAVVSGTKPIMATECGYHNDVTTYGGVPESVSAKYIPRMFMLNAMNGIKRSYLYELLDDPDQSGPEAAFGLIRADGSVKPAYNALKNLISILGTEPAALSPLNYTLGGPSVAQVLLQKANGAWLLVLWQEVSCYDLPARKEIVNPSVIVTLTLPSKMAATTYEPLIQEEPWAVQVTNKMTVAVNDHLTVIELQ